MKGGVNPYGVFFHYCISLVVIQAHLEGKQCRFQRASSKTNENHETCKEEKLQFQEQTIGMEQYYTEMYKIVNYMQTPCTWYTQQAVSLVVKQRHWQMIATIQQHLKQTSSQI